MDDVSNGYSNSPAAPFLLKTYEMVDDPLTSSIVSWSPSGLSLVVWNPPEFARDLLPKYFKHNNFSSFIRQLNTYGFRKVDPEQWEFANEEFIRGQRHLLKNIHRRKPIHSHSSQANAAPPLTDSERVEYVKMIENLKQEKHSLQSELERHKHDNREYENQLRSLGQTLHNIDQRQQQLVASLARLLQKPSLHAFSSSLPELSRNKKRRYSQDEEASLVGQSLSTNLSHPLINMDLVEKLDSSVAFWDKLIDQIPANHHHHHHHPDFNDDDDDCCCSPYQVGSGASDSPPISSICIDLESNDKPSGEVDANTGTPTTTVNGCGAIASVPQAAGANDVFWQQFLTEAPDASVARQVQSDTRRDFHNDDDNRKKDDGGATNYQQNKPWWINVDHKVTQQMMGPS